MKKLVSFLLGLALILGMAIGVSAAQPVLVNDFAGLLTYDEASGLEQQALALREDFGIDTVILTLDSLNGYSAQTTADDYYDQNGYGDDGVLFLLAMEEREWYISTAGNCIYALTDYGLYEMEEAILPYLQSGDYHGAFEMFLLELSHYMKAYTQGDIIDGYVPQEEQYHGHTDVVYEEKGVNWFLSIAVGLIAAAITVGIMRSTMNTKRLQHSAGDYLKDGSFHMRQHQDIFLYSQVSKTRKPDPPSNSGGGSGVHRSSSGRSHGGRGGKF